MDDLDKVREETAKADLPLKETAKNLVFGRGNPEADIIFIGESPGAKEDSLGEPFVGAAGKNLDLLLRKVGLSIDDIYIANILKYRPPENRDPLPSEIEEHGVWLLRQIKVIRPKVICSLGNYATKFFLAGCKVEGMKNVDGITKIHGKPQMIKVAGIDIKLIPLFHPAAIIYNRSLGEEWEKDMLIVKKEIE